MPPAPFKPLHYLLLVALALVYTVYTVAQWSYGYIDFGDGNYMYIGWQIAGGTVVYRDMLAPQPPMHLYLGALVYKLGVLVGADPLWAFRTASILIHLVTLGLVAALAWRAWGRPGIAVGAAAIYLWLPIGFRWALGWQSEPLEIVWLLSMMLCALRGTKRGDVAAGIFATLAAMTNLTAAPFLLILIVYMWCVAPKRAAWMAGPSIVLAGIITAAMEIYTGGYFLNNVVFNQVGTYPPNLLEYAILDKLLPQSGSVFVLEGAFVIFGLVGLARFVKESPLMPVARGGLAWFFVGTLGSILYVTKGGTMDYIFSLSEPAVAILAAGELAAWLRRWWCAPPLSRTLLQRVVGVPILLAVVLFAFPRGALLHYQLFIHSKTIYELPPQETLEIVSFIKSHSEPGDRILAPPHYAFLAKRPLWGNYSELLIWTIKYYNDRRASGDTVTTKTPYMKDTDRGQGVAKIRDMVEAINSRRLPLIILEMDQTGAIPDVMRAVKANYEPQPRLIPTNNTRLGVFLPAAPNAKPSPARWQDFQHNVLMMYGIQGAAKFPWIQDRTGLPNPG